MNNDDTINKKTEGNVPDTRYLNWIFLRVYCHCK